MNPLARVNFQVVEQLWIKYESVYVEVYCFALSLFLLLVFVIYHAFVPWLMTTLN